MAESVFPIFTIRLSSQNYRRNLFKTKNVYLGSTLMALMVIWSVINMPLSYLSWMSRKKMRWRPRFWPFPPRQVTGNGRSPSHCFQGSTAQMSSCQTHQRSAAQASQTRFSSSRSGIGITAASSSFMHINDGNWKSLYVNLLLNLTVAMQL